MLSSIGAEQRLKAFSITEVCFENVSFKLPIKGGAMIEVEVCNGKLLKSEITMRENVTPKKFNLYFKDRKI